MLKETIQQDMKQAMMGRNEEALLPLRMLIAEIKNMEIQKGGSSYVATDEDVISVVEKQIKQRRDSITAFENGGRPELAEKEKKEIEFLQVYLPVQLSEAEIDSFVDDAIKSTGATSAADMGKVMAWLMPFTKGKADGAVVSQKVRAKLG